MVVEPDPSHVVLADDEPVVWRVTFPEPTDAVLFTVGRRPVDGREEVPLAEPLANDVRYQAFLEFDNGIDAHGRLEISKLRENFVFYHNKYMSETDFNKAKQTCSRSPSR